MTAFSFLLRLLLEMQTQRQTSSGWILWPAGDSSQRPTTETETETLQP